MSPTMSESELRPLVLIQGPEDLLVERAVDQVTQQARLRDVEVERSVIEASTYQPGMLSIAASPSLFGESALVVVQGAEAATDALITDMAAYATNPALDATVVVVHRGGVRGKRMLDAMKAAGAAVVTVAAVKKDSDKVAFVTNEFRAAQRRIDVNGVRALVDAVGVDLRELAAACAQLVTDTTGTVTAEVVARYYGGRIEATAFRVADAAVAGDSGQAVALLRHALLTGADPVPIVAALAMKLRGLAKVGSLRGRTAGGVDLGMAPWQIDRARRELSRWSPEGLAAAIEAVAAADAEVKGGGRDPIFAVERAVLTICAQVDARS